MIASVSTILVSLVFAASLAGGDAYIAGKDAERRAKYGDAVKAYAQCAEAEGPLTAYALVRAARCRELSGDTEGAAAEYARLIQHYERGPWVGMAKTYLAALHQAEDRTTDALPLYRDVLSVSLRPWWFTAVRAPGYECLIADPASRAEAFGYFRDVADTTWQRKRRLDAVDVLVRSTDSDDRFSALTAMLRSREYRSAAKHLEAFLPSMPDSVVTGPQWQYLQGRVAIAAGRAAEGRGMLEGVPRRFTDSPWAARALEQLVRHHEYNNRAAESARYLSELERAYADSEAVGDALWWLGERRRGKGNSAEAVKFYQRLVQNSSHHDRADDALLAVGHIQRGRKLNKSGIDSYRELLRRYPKSTLVSEAAYWSGHLHADAGHTDEARADFARGTKGPIGAFYTHRAADRLLEIKGGSATAFSGGNTAFVQPVAAKPKRLDPFPASWTEDVRHRRMRFFARQGYVEAEWEALYAAESLRDASTIGTLFRAMSESGVSYSAEQMARALEWGLKGGAPTLDKHRLHFARAYWPDVLAASRETGVDPLLILAVARQESTFRPALTSSAGASGVMQVMPGTAKYISDIEPAISRADIRNLEYPVASIRLGAFYLMRMIEMRDGNLVYALASYNAGPGNCNKWLKSLPRNDIDAFIEGIGFSETKNYVKRVLGNYAAYHSIYDEYDKR
jgi:soluble lytic murein transglycosylase